MKVACGTSETVRGTGNRPVRNCRGLELVRWCSFPRVLPQRNCEPMNPTLHVIASCADRKTVGCGPELQLRRFRQPRPEERLARWWSALSSHGPCLPAEDLYVGPYWSTIRGLAETNAAQKFAMNLWVASAGYGLVSVTAPIRPYSATFRTNLADSVVRQRDAKHGFGTKHWWSALARKRLGPAPSPRSIAALAASNPRARILIIGSAPYIAAMEDDLTEALALLRDRDQLLIVSGEPGPKRPSLRECWIESRARLLTRVGGSLPALHARVARQILNEVPRYGLDSARLRARWARIAQGTPEVMKPHRLASTDQDVKQFIRSAIAKEPWRRHTPLLHDFRATGRACEQSRFRSLYLQIVQEVAR